MKREKKDYIGRRFEVEPTKLTKLLKVMHEKLPGSSADQSDLFVVHMVGNRTAQLQTLDELLALDNSAKQRIVRLQIHSACCAPSATSPQSEIDVDFGATFKTGTGSSQSGVSIEVAGESGIWVADTLSEVEQQVERCWVQHGLPMASIGLIILASLFLILISAGQTFGPAEDARGYATQMWLSGEDISPYAEKLSRSEALTEDEQRQLFSRQIANVSTVLKHYHEAQQESRRSLGRSLLSVAAIALVGIVLLVRGYPAVAFLWGDEKSRQETRERVKRLLWAVLLAISFIPVLVQLFLPSLISGLK